jgi:predicted esterase
VHPQVVQRMLLAFYFAILGSASCLWADEPRDLNFVSEKDGSQQKYVLVPPDDYDPSKPISILIALHGHGSDRWQFILQERDECRATRDAAKKFRMLLVAPDYRAKTSWMGPAAEADLVQIIRDLKKRYRVKKLIVSGGSMGGTGALTFAALHPELVDGVVAMNGTANLVEYDQFQDAIAESFGGTKEAVPDEYRKRSAELQPKQLKMPIALTTGGRDELVPADSVLRLADALSKQGTPVLLIHQPQGGHETNYEDATKAFEFVLGKMD